MEYQNITNLMLDDAWVCPSGDTLENVKMNRVHYCFTTVFRCYLGYVASLSLSI